MEARLMKEQIGCFHTVAGEMENYIWHLSAAVSIFATAGAVSSELQLFVYFHTL